jgi:hypothetical protein
MRVTPEFDLGPRLPDSGEIRHPRNVTRRIDADLERALFALLKIGAGCGVHLAGSVGELEFDWAATLNLEAIVKLGSGRKCSNAKACTGVIDFEQSDR